MSEREPNPPRIGPPNDDYRAVCSFALKPGVPPCRDPATLHLLVTSTEYGEGVTLTSCDDHVSIARSAGVVQQEHRFNSGVCCLPGTLWDEVENLCVFDTSGVEPVVLGHATVSA